MTLEELLVKDQRLSKYLEEKETGKFSDLKGKRNFKFRGIYFILENDEIVYIGSAYTRDVHARLMQYTREKDSGNTLAQDIIDSGKRQNVKDAVSYIMTLDIVAIKYSDFECDLINLTDSIINKNGYYDD